MDTDYEALLDRLRAAGCPYKLYPARLRALEIVTGERLLAEVEAVITMRIALSGGVDVGWKHQFKRDLETYGLLEAILYFHSYPPLDPGFVEDACVLYERLAKLCVERHDEMEASDDPRIHVHLEALRRQGDSHYHTVLRPEQLKLAAPDRIAPPERPPPIEGYERRLPVHPDVAMIGIQGDVRTFADELLEHLTASFSFEGFPGIQLAFAEVAHIAAMHDVDVFGGEGQYVLAGLVRALDEELFGDFERWVPCAECGEEFFVEVTLETVNLSLIEGGWRCPGCRGAPGG